MHGCRHGIRLACLTMPRCACEPHLGSIVKDLDLGNASGNHRCDDAAKHHGAHKLENGGNLQHAGIGTADSTHRFLSCMATSPTGFRAHHLCSGIRNAHYYVVQVSPLPVVHSWQQRNAVVHAAQCCKELTMTACLRVRVFAPTLVPNALATSLEPASTQRHMRSPIKGQLMAPHAAPRSLS